MRRLKKNVYLGLCGTLLAALSLVRACTRPEVEPTAAQSTQFKVRNAKSTAQRQEAQPDSGRCTKQTAPSLGSSGNAAVSTAASLAEGQPKVPFVRHPIRGVHDYHACFPDSQNVQIVAARRWGVPPVRDRGQAEERKGELVFVGSNPYYVMDSGMRSSIPYLVPRAALLLQDIGRNYLDSLHVKGVPLHRIIVTSVLRSEHDVRELQKRNGNVSPESCHRFATTFDIAYNRYNTVQPPGERRREVRNDTLKWILSEVLRDLRRDGRCYVKYEVKQGCFHITTR